MRHARTRVLVDENGTESGGVDAQISVTASVDSSGYNMFHGWTPLCFWAVFSGCCSGRLLVAVALGLGLVAFGSVSVTPWFCPWSRFVSVGFNPGGRRAPTPRPAVIQRSLFGWHPFPFLCSGTLGLSIRSIASRRALGCGLRDGSDGWRSPVPRGDNTGGRDYVHPLPSIAFWARRQVPKFVTGRAVDSVRDGRYSIPRRVRRCGVISHALSRQPILSSVSLRRLRLGATPDVEASCITSCCGRRVPFSERRCGVTVCLQSRRRQPVLPYFFLRE